MELPHILNACNIKEKELYKTKAFLVCAEDILLYEHEHRKVIDLCCGNGLLGMYIATTAQRTVIAIDHRMSTKHKRLSTIMHTRYNLNTHSFIQKDLWDTSLLDMCSDNALLLSIHACGHLTDRVIELAVASRSPVAVMPCCPARYDSYFHPIKMPGKNCHAGKYHNNVRLHYLLEQDFSITRAHIDSRITPYNEVLLAIPH